MALEIGSRLGHYDVTALIGAAGVGIHNSRARGVPTLTFLAALVTAACTSTPVPTMRSEPERDTVRLFTGARLVVGDGRVIDDAAFVVRRDLIVDAGRVADVDAPLDAFTLDLTGQTVMPALVNTHAHLGWEKYTSWGAENFTRENLIDHLNRHAYYGVGTIISTGSDDESIALQIQHDQRLGKVGGARYLVSPGLGTPGGGPNPRFTDDEGWWGLHHVTSPQEAREVIRGEQAKGIQIVKIWIDARDERRGAGVKLAPDIYRSILDEASVRDIRVIAHATTLEDHKQLLRAGGQRFIHMPYDHDVDDEYLALAEARNAYVVPTLGMVTRREPHRRPVFEDPFFQRQVSPDVIAFLRGAAARSADTDSTRTAAAEARSRRIKDNFVKLADHVILGTDAGAVGDFFGYADHLELELFVRLGMTPSQAIVAATSRAAAAFGLTQVGTLAAGRIADFVVLDANPLEDIMNTRTIARVYLRGEEVERDALRSRWTQ